MVVIVVIIPVLVFMPTLLFSIPPLMVAIPTSLAFGGKVMAPLVRLVAMLTMLANRVIQSRFRLLDAMLAFRSLVVGVRTRYCHKRKERDSGECCQRRSTRFGISRSFIYLHPLLLEIGQSNSAKQQISQRPF